jgi:Flp pilus assembly protein TadB
MLNIINAIGYKNTNDIAKEIADNLTNMIYVPDGLLGRVAACFNDIEAIMLSNKLYLTMILSGVLLILTGIYISSYKKPFSYGRKKLTVLNNTRHLKYIEHITKRYPLKILSQKLEGSLSYFMLDNAVQENVTAFFTLLIPITGISLYIALMNVLNLWYTRLVTLALCIMLPYYIFTLVLDYMKYSLRLKIPLLIDSFRSSFMTHCRIKPALQECSTNIDKSLGRIMNRVSDSSDLNQSLNMIRSRINDTWFNIFVLLLINYRENGGELIGQLYKLNRSITRYNNIEKKKNKRLIWYEVFTVSASIFSLPIIILMNKMILGISTGLYYDTTAAFAKVVVFSLSALIVVRILRRM